MSQYKYYIHKKDSNFFYRVNSKTTQGYSRIRGTWEEISNPSKYAKWRPEQWHKLNYRLMTKEEVFIELL